MTTALPMWSIWHERRAKRYLRLARKRHWWKARIRPGIRNWNFWRKKPKLFLVNIGKMRQKNCSTKLRFVPFTLAICQVWLCLSICSEMSEPVELRLSKASKTMWDQILWIFRDILNKAETSYLSKAKSTHAATVFIIIEMWIVTVRFQLHGGRK